MRFLAIHPSCLMFSTVFLRLEPLGLELIAEAVRREGHEVQFIDLQVDSHKRYFRTLEHWRPEAAAFSCNYLANVPEIVDLAKATKAMLPDCFVFVGGHSASFTAKSFLAHAEGAIDCILTGEGEASIARLLQAVAGDVGLLDVPGVVTKEGNGPPPVFVQDLDALRPARDLVKRRKYFIGVLDPCASIEFSRGCPWDCSFCSAWTFYGRSYRVKTPQAAVEELTQIKERGIFIVDDVAFIQSKHAMEIGEAIARQGIKKRYYLETRGDVLLRNKEAFEFWSRLGLEYMFLGLEAIDEEGLKKFRKRVTLSTNFEALEFARSLGIMVAINIIADPEWDERQFAVMREWCLEIPEIVTISVNTPYPGTETWQSESPKLISRDYRLFDIQHAVLPTKLPLDRFYEELIRTQQVLNKKHMGMRGLIAAAGEVTRQLARGQTNFLRMLWKFNSVYNPKLQLADHQRPVRYEMALPPAQDTKEIEKIVYVHAPRGRRGRSIDNETEHFVDQTRTMN